MEKALRDVMEAEDRKFLAAIDRLGTQAAEDPRLKALGVPPSFREPGPLDAMAMFLEWAKAPLRPDTIVMSPETWADLINAQRQWTLDATPWFPREFWSKRLTETYDRLHGLYCQLSWRWREFRMTPAQRAAIYDRSHDEEDCDA